jgi:hypothetical protein
VPGEALAAVIVGLLRHRREQGITRKDERRDPMDGAYTDSYEVPNKPY